MICFAAFWGHTSYSITTGTAPSPTLPKGWSSPERCPLGRGCTFLDYDRDGFLDLLYANYIKLDPDKISSADATHVLPMEGCPIMCGPRGLPAAYEYSVSQQRRWDLHRRSEKAGILKPVPGIPSPLFRMTSTNDGWPDIFVAVDSPAQHSVSEQP